MGLVQCKTNVPTLHRIAWWWRLKGFSKENNISYPTKTNSRAQTSQANVCKDNMDSKGVFGCPHPAQPGPQDAVGRCLVSCIRAWTWPMGATGGAEPGSEETRKSGVSWWPGSRERKWVPPHVQEAGWRVFLGLPPAVPSLRATCSPFPYRSYSLTTHSPLPVFSW